MSKASKKWEKVDKFDKFWTWGTELGAWFPRETRLWCLMHSPLSTNGQGQEEWDATEIETSSKFFQKEDYHKKQYQQKVVLIPLWSCNAIQLLMLSSRALFFLISSADGWSSCPSQQYSYRWGLWVTSKQVMPDNTLETLIPLPDPMADMELKELSVGHGHPLCLL